MDHKWIFAALIALCLMLVLFSSYSSFQYRAAQEKSMAENVQLLQTIAQLKGNLEKTQSRIQVVEDALDQYSGLSVSLRTLLIAKGHVDPEGFLLNVLKEKEDLIQSTPVLGGTFFYTKMIILRDDLAFAEFEDGHVSGYLLIAFQYDGSQDQVEASHVFEFLE